MSLHVGLSEEVLRGGTTNAGLVTRVGDTVRRPIRPTSAATWALLDHLESVGFAGAPRHLGVDDQGREVLSYIPGRAALRPYPAWALTDQALISVAHLVREYHHAVAGFDPGVHDWPRPLPPQFRDGTLCHNDLNLDNIVFVDGQARALIDFDLAGPGSVGWDLAGCARLWVPLEFDRDRPLSERRALRRLRLFADAYGATPAQRGELVEAMVPCHDWCYRIVQEAAESGHEAFRHDWLGPGQQLAARTRRWLIEHPAQMCYALGIA